MKKNIFIFLVIVFVFSCKNGVKNIHNQKIPNANSKEILKKDTIAKYIDNLPFGNYALIKYPFKKGIWHDDYDDIELQKVVKSMFFLDSIKQFEVKNIPIINIPSKKYQYYSLEGKSSEHFEKSKTVDKLYILKKNDSFKIYYAGATIINKGIKTFENNYSWYIITVSNNDEFIDAITFNDEKYSETEYSDRWKFLNKKLSYINKSKIISSYDFLCKEWDMNYEFKLVKKKRFKITKAGLIQEL